MPGIVFITGATSGFGKACAFKFAYHGYDCIINGRRKDRLSELSNTLEKKYNVAVLTLPFDVQNQKDVFQSIAQIPQQWQKIDILINNAGLALGRDYFDEASLEDWNTMMPTKVAGLLYASKAMLRLMIKEKQAHVINIGSTAGKEVYERGNVYCASKHAVAAISESMRIDLLRHHIKVTAIHPGAAETEFSIVRFKGDEDTAAKVYDGFKPLSAEDVADVIYYTTSLPPHICINDLVLTATQQANSFYFNRSGK